MAMTSHVSFGTKISNTKYCDIVIMGRTGLGKSMLGNKLLQAPDRNRLLSAKQRAKFRTKFEDVSTREKPWTGFWTAEYLPVEDRKHAGVTQECKLVANEKTKVRVLDTPGLLFPSKETYDANWNVCLQISKQLHRRKKLIPVKCQRVLYFFPTRGVPEKIDANLREELKVIYEFFGTDIFKHMIIIATQDKRSQSVPFDATDCGQVKDIFSQAISIVTNGNFNSRASPPVVYIGCNDTHREVMDKLKVASILSDSPFFKPAYKVENCSNCSLDILCSVSSEVGLLTPVGVSNADSAYKTYKNSRCHPYFVPKFSRKAKIAGTIGHTLTLGIPHVLSRLVIKGPLWPGMFNSEKICPICHGSPGSEGCCEVEKTVKVQGTEIEIDHSYGC